MSITERMLNKLAGLPAPRRPAKAKAAGYEETGYSASAAREEKREAERYAGIHGQPCGGGRRVIRKRIGE